MSTASTDAIATTLRTHLLTFEPAPDAGTLGDVLGERLYRDAAPDSPTYPYGVMRLINRVVDGAYNGDRESMDLEVQLFHRPRRATATLETAADRCDIAMQRYADASDGLLFSRERTRDTLPPFPEPADREVVQIRLVYPLVAWPTYLTHGAF